MTLIIRTTGIEDYLDGGEANIKALILGPPSAGKTRSASYWPLPIFADCEKGRMAIADRKMPYAQITSSADMDALLKMLALECKKPVAQRKYKTLVIDTVDSFQRIVIAERLEAEKKEALSGWGDWGYLDGKMTQLVAKLQALPMNIVVNVHVKDSDLGDDDSKLRVTGVKLKGDFKDQIAAEFDLVGLMGTYWEAENGERVLKRGVQWWPDPSHPILKDRSGQLPRWTPVTFSDDDYVNLFSTLISHLDNLGESEVLEELQTDPQVTHEPVKPQAGGPVAGAPLQPAATPRKAAAAPAKTAPPAKAAPPPPAKAAEPPKAESAKITEAVLGDKGTPTDVGTQPVKAAPPPAAPKPEIGGAETPPQPTPTPVAEPEAEQPTEAAESAAEAPAEEPMSPEAVAEALGAEVVSDPPAAEEPASDAPATDEAGQQDGTGGQGQAEVPTDDGSGPLVCGSAALPPDEQPEGFVPVQGCGKTLDDEANPDLVEIAVLKTRTNLCNACFAAWRASNK